MSTTLILAAAAIAVTFMLCFAASRAWQGWLELKRLELTSQEAAAGPADPDIGLRIELAAVRERMRELEEIASTSNSRRRLRRLARPMAEDKDFALGRASHRAMPDSPRRCDDRGDAAAARQWPARERYPLTERDRRFRLRSARAARRPTSSILTGRVRRASRRRSGLDGSRALAAERSG